MARYPAPAGRVSIKGKIDRLNGGGTFTFVWRETGGPAVTKPTRRGFGSIILLDFAKHLAKAWSWTTRHEVYATSFSYN